MNSTDERVIELLLDGDPDTLATVRGWIRSQSASLKANVPAEDLEDLEQQVLLELLQKLDTAAFEGRSSFETFVRSFAKFRALDRVRSKARSSELTLPADPGLASVDVEEQRLAADLARAVLAQLPEECRTYWDLIYRGHSYREMSQRYGVSEGTLRVRVHRCRELAAEAKRRLQPAERKSL